MDDHFFAQTQTNGVRHKGAFTRMTGSNKSESKQKTDPAKGEGWTEFISVRSRVQSNYKRGGTATQDLFGRRQPSIFEHRDVSFGILLYTKWLSQFAPVH
ncbi:hypothetical protein CEXT_469521 [Caerostris extrusa]|uniref:Uncharacterized protein n=1 Tax=Caerostris extrusa TaxID=172846 RepID=A0AAV4PA54_CAEEX|nr:hypothetical protein CEXT_469521 [Caerostris extrusa]